GCPEVERDFTALQKPVEARLDCRDVRVKTFRKENRLRIGIDDHAFKRIGCGHGGERNRDGAGPQNPQKGSQIERRVQAEDRDLVAFSDAEAGEVMRRPVDIAVKIAPARDLMIENDRRLLRRALRRPADAVGDGDKGRKWRLERGISHRACHPLKPIACPTATLSPCSFSTQISSSTRWRPFSGAILATIPLTLSTSSRLRRLVKLTFSSPPCTQSGPKNSVAICER